MLDADQPLENLHGALQCHTGAQLPHLAEVLDVPHQLQHALAEKPTLRHLLLHRVSCHPLQEVVHISLADH
jgi:hypothetical protein